MIDLKTDLPFGSFASSMNGVAAYSVASAPPEGAFILTNYGADPTGIDDSGVALQAAADAAAAVATAESPADVWIPTGNYKCIPQGYAKTTVWQKAAGSWGTALASDLVANTTVSGTGTFHFLDTDPTAEGVDGDIAFQYRSGRVWLKSSGSWSLDGKVTDNAGTGWQSGFIDETPTGGADGDWAVQYELIFDKINGAVCRLTQAHNYVRFSGPGLTAILKLQCWSDVDPMSYSVDTGTQTVISSNIPLARYSGYKVYKRGSMFVMEPDGLGNFEGIEFHNFRLDGQTLANGGGSWYNAYDFLHEWDITNKGIVFTFGGRDMGQTAPIKVEDCEIVGFRGEVLYKGGTDSDCYVEIRRCTIGETNSSTVSISGQSTVEDCTFYNMYNGTENQCFGSQYSIVRRCTFNGLATGPAGGWSTSNGVVYIGDEVATCLVEDCDFNSIGSKCIFFNDSANNITIRRCNLDGALQGVSFQFMGNIQNVLFRFRNVLIEDCVFTDTFRCVFFQNGSGGNCTPWTIRNCTCSGGINAFLYDNYNSDRSTHDVTIDGGTFTSTETSWALQGSDSQYTPLVPRYTGVINYTPVTNKGIWSAGEYTERIMQGPTTRYGRTDYVMTDYNLNVDKWAVGESVRIEVSGNNPLPMLPDTWNNWVGTETIAVGGYVVLTVNANGKFDLTASGSL